MTGPGVLPLAGVTVVDLGQVIAGPSIAALLGDFGAEVIKIENPAGGDQVRQFGHEKHGASLHSKLISRNKRSVAIDLRQPAGQDLVRRLLVSTEADILIESFRPGTLERWNLSYERLKQDLPGLIVVRVSGFGQSGPYRDRPGFGTLAEAMSGFAHVTGQADGPPTLPPFAVADTVAALQAAVGALVALYHRDTTAGGEGQVIDVSLLEPIFSMLGIYLVEYDQLGIVPERKGNRTASAPRNTYATGDGRWIAIAGSTQSITVRLFEAIGRPEMIGDPRFATNRARGENADELDAIIGQWVGARTQDEAVETLIAAGVAVAPILHAGDLMVDPHLEARDAIVTVPDDELGSVRMPAVQPVLSATPGRIRHAGPRLGEHTAEVLSEYLDLSAAELEALRADGVIALAEPR
jgi:crotonobetainyl-CoA:carnitine CoA-transferase CaiB-like acyl-CoA transferase